MEVHKESQIQVRNKIYSSIWTILKDKSIFNSNGLRKSLWEEIELNKFCVDCDHNTITCCLLSIVCSSWHWWKHLNHFYYNSLPQNCKCHREKGCVEPHQIEDYQNHPVIFHKINFIWCSLCIDI